MKKKLFYILLAVGILAVSFVALYFILPTAYGAKLSPPENVDVEGYMLRWSTVPYSVGYEVDIDGEVSFVSENEIKLSYSHRGKKVRIKAVADQRRRKSSDFGSEFTVEFNDDYVTKNGLVSFDCPLDKFSFKEFNYKDEPLPVPNFDYASSGYAVDHWYVFPRIGEKRILNKESPLMLSGDVELFVKIDPISYPVSFNFPNGFEPPLNLPVTYTVESVANIAAVSSQSKGSCVSGWAIGSADGEMLTASARVLGELDLYARVDPITDGLRFERLEEGGYALIDYAGNSSVVHVPAYYNGEEVKIVEEGAFKFDGEDGQLIESIVFYGEIMLEKGCVFNLPSLKSLVFYSSVTLKEKAVTCMNLFPIELVFHSNMTLDDGFLRFALGESAPISVWAKGEHLQYIKQKLPDASVEDITDM